MSWVRGRPFDWKRVCGRGREFGWDACGGWCAWRCLDRSYLLHGGDTAASFTLWGTLDIHDTFVVFFKCFVGLSKGGRGEGVLYLISTGGGGCEREIERGRERERETEIVCEMGRSIFK